MTDAAEHRAEVEAWRRSRYAALRRDLGWLTLAGLGWLRPGVNRLGAENDNDIVLPGGPPHAGTFTLTDARVVASGAFFRDGSPAIGLRMIDDKHPNADATVLSLGALRICVIRRGERFGVRTWDLDAPLRRHFEGIDHWPVDPAWRVEGRFERTPGRRLLVPDVLGPGAEQESPGDVLLTLGGARHRLQALPGEDDGPLWLVFGDATNGGDTYAGGRFVYTEAPQPDGRVIVDFNRAYNPPCVFSPYATCPLPWPANRLPVGVEAGERAFHRPG